MIQRIQSLFLLGIALFAVILFFTPFQIALLSDSKTFDIFISSGFHSPSVKQSVFALFSVNVIIIGLSLFTIFKFKNRVLQYKLANILMLLNIVLLALFFLLNFYDGTVSFSFGAFLPIVGVAFSFLAAHFIKKDEQLVRSSDRIR